MTTAHPNALRPHNRWESIRARRWKLSSLTFRKPFDHPPPYNCFPVNETHPRALNRPAVYSWTIMLSHTAAFPFMSVWSPKNRPIRSSLDTRARLCAYCNVRVQYCSLDYAQIIIHFSERAVRSAFRARVLFQVLIYAQTTRGVWYFHFGSISDLLDSVLCQTVSETCGRNVSAVKSAQQIHAIRELRVQYGKIY